MPYTFYTGIAQYHIHTRNGKNCTAFINICHLICRRLWLNNERFCNCNCAFASITVFTIRLRYFANENDGKTTTCRTHTTSNFGIRNATEFFVDRKHVWYQKAVYGYTSIVVQYYTRSVVPFFLSIYWNVLWHTGYDSETVYPCWVCWAFCFVARSYGEYFIRYALLAYE